MLEALAAALLVGLINTLADYISVELKLQAKPIYLFARIALTCYAVGGIVGARARQLMMGMVGGLMIGAFVSAAYYMLAPSGGSTALVVAWLVFWVGFSLLEALLQGGTGVVGGLLQGVAAAPNTRLPAELITDPAALKQLKLLWLSVGNRDNLLRVSKGVHDYLTEKGVPHVWRVDTNGHDTGVMSDSLYHFAQKLFKE